MGLRVRIDRLRKRLCPHINAARGVVGEMMQDLYEDFGYLFRAYSAGTRRGERSVYDLYKDIRVAIMFYLSKPQAPY